MTLFEKKLESIFEVSGMENMETLFLSAKITKKFQKTYVDMVDIPKEDVIEIESTPHMTFLYLPAPVTGISERELYEVTKPILSGKSFEITTKKFHVFKGVGWAGEKDKADCLVVKLNVSEELKECRQKVKEAILDNGGKFKETYPTYEPHMTIAYFEKGTIQKTLPKFKEETLEIPGILFQFGGSDKETKKY